MVKCHAMICLNIAKKYGLQLPTLERYVKEPDVVLKELSAYYFGASPSACKMLVNSVLNRGTTGGWVAKQEQEDLQKATGMLPQEAKRRVKYGGVADMAVINMMFDFKMGKQIMDKVKKEGNHPVILGLDQNIGKLHKSMRIDFPDVFNDAIDTIKRDAKLRREYPTTEKMRNKAFSDCLFEVEKRLLHAIVRSLISQGFKVVALIHDGCHVRKTEGMETISQEVISKVVADVKEETNFDIKLKVKEMEEPPISKMKKRIKAHDAYIENFEEQQIVL
jgi:hypothetical protein